MTPAAAALLVVASVHANPLTPAERRGRELFVRGASVAGRPVSVTMNGEPTPVTFACAGCHGRDGRGRFEGGLRPPDVRWQTLARPVRAAGARPSRPAYDLAKLRRAVTMGIDPAGRRLDPVMPRYHLQREDADDILAFLGRVGTFPDPGLTLDTFRVGVFLPAGRERAAVRRTIETWAADLTARGGIYARRPEVVLLEEGAAKLGRLSEETEPFVLLGDPGAASLEAVAAWVATREVPWLRVTEAGDWAAPFDRWIVQLAGSAGDGPSACLSAVTSLERALAKVGREASRERLVEAFLE